MNIRPRFSISILISLSVHLALLLWALPQMQKPQPEGQGLLQVFIEKHAGLSAKKTSEVTRVSKAADPIPITHKIGTSPSGHFLWQPPPSRDPNEVANAMQLAQLAQQRESQRYAVSSGLSNLSVQLRPVITGNILCKQQVSTLIECLPEPDEKIRPLLEQFLFLALQAHQLGIATNPVRLDFGSEQGLSVEFSR